jgi:hypothetical protein
MPETILQSIDRFEENFQEYLKEIGLIHGPGDTLHFRRILYLSVLDSLSKIALPKERQHNLRVTTFLKQYSEWKECERISLPHLARLLEITSDHMLEPLRIFVSNCISKWEPNSIILLDRSPSLEEIEKICPINYMYKVQVNNGKSIELQRLMYLYLFYNYRNSLMHELKGLGLLSNMPEVAMSSNEPHYSYVPNNISEDGVVEDSSWELIYPIEFYERITIKCLANLCTHLRLNMIDPYQIRTSHTYWIDELNQE